MDHKKKTPVKKITICRVIKGKLFCWKYLSEVIIMMYHTAMLYSDMGKNVLLDGVLVERVMAKNIEYKLRADTSLYSAAECADIIVKALF